MDQEQLIIQLSQMTEQINSKINRNANYLKQNEKSQFSLKESIKNKCTNIIYKVGSIQLSSLWKKENPGQIYLQGHSYQTSKQAHQALKKIIWFTYRSNFKVSEELTSDTGWGCLLRVAQMVLAAALVKFYSTHTQFSQETLSNIIYAFLDDKGEQEKYSVSSMMKVASKMFSMKAGQWFNIAQIGYIIEKLQNQKPMKGSNLLKVRTFNQSIIFLQDVFNDLGVKFCTCTEPKIICQNCNDSSKKKLQISLLILVVTRLAIGKISNSSYQGILQLVSHSTSLGIIGGVPKKALYIVGRQDEQLIYLDPHYVQQSVNRKSFSHHFSTFFTNDCRKLSQNNLDSSMGFSFYISSLEQLQALSQLLNSTKQHGNNGFLSIMWGTQNRNQEHTQSYEFSNEFSDQGFFL